MVGIQHNADGTQEGIPTLKDRVEYFVFRSLETAVLSCPPWILPSLGAWFGRLGYWMDRKHRKVGVANVQAVFPEMVGQPAQTAIMRNFEHMGMFVTEITAAHRFIRRSTLDRYIAVEGAEHMEAALANGKGVILVLGHLGNWEVIGRSFPDLGYPVRSVARPIDNPLLHAHMNRFRSERGMEIIRKKNALRNLVTVLKTNGITAMLIDQDARKKGVFVEFFDRLSSTFQGAAGLSLRFGSALVPLEIWREPGFFRHRMKFHPPLFPEDFSDNDDPELALTQKYTEIFEGFVRRHPSQWFWLHRRWKTRHPKTDRDPNMPYQK